MEIKLPQGWSLIEKEETDSTNEDVKKLPPGSDKTAVCARIQTGGRGRMGRRWVSPAGNLYVSFCLEPVGLAQAGLYSFVAAVALTQAIEKLCPGLRVSCKWPNDLLINGKKVTGILLETNGVDRLIVGIGVNLAPVDERQMLYPVTSLRGEGFHIERAQMLEALLNCFDGWQKCLQTLGSGPVLEVWKQKACGIGGPVTVNLPDRQLKGTFYGLDQDGCFLLNKEGEILKITAGDVFFGQTGK